MAAPNKEPFGSRPGPKAPHVHAPHSGSKPDGGKSKPSGQGVGGHGTPKPVGSNKKNPLH